MNSQDVELAEAQCLLTKYTTQLTTGCSQISCDNQQCATGRRNTSSRPVRDYKVRTARLVATQILSKSNPRQHLCRFLDSKQVFDPTFSSQHDDIRDPSSFGQRLSDSLANVLPVNTIEDSSEAPIPALDSATCRLRDAKLGLDALLVKPYHGDGIPDPDFVDNKHASEVLIGNCLSVHTVYEHEESQVWSAARLVALFKGCIVETRYRWKDPQRLLDEMTSYRSYCDWLMRICEVVAFRCSLDDVLRKRTRVRCTSFDTELLRGMEDNISGPADPHTIACLLPLEMLQHIFRANYDGEVTIKHKSVAHGALICMSIMRRSSIDGGNYTLDWSNHDAQRPDAIAQAWLASVTAHLARRTVILLDFPFIFSPAELLTALRIVCHIRMRDTQLSAGLIDRIFDRYNSAPTALSRHPAIPITAEEQSMHEVAFRREKYLILLVSRGEILRDTFDQLWQRRRSELLCPLRVRLGDAIGEMGQDLGGVQVEFFNLICRAVLDEGAGMFTTDSATGLSWFSIGSLQPLHMFELVGVLLALAIHNGIAIPVSFPLALYKHLLDRPIGGWDDIADAWPVKMQSFVAFIEADLDDDHVFHFVANGLHLELDYVGLETLRRDRQAYEEGRCSSISMFYSPASPSNQQDSFSESSSLGREGLLHWPGWIVKQAPTTFDGSTRATNAQYALDYVDWLTTFSIFPQLHALRRGFHSILPAPLLAFLTPRQLQTALEGTPTLSMDDWRRSTTYTAFSTAEPYIESFWRIVASWPLDLQRGLLRFVTSAERVPVSGNLIFNISRAWGKEDLLPTSSTCYCILNLPVYESEGMLEEKLRTAIEWGGEGFGQA
ncbi:hypothetical protein LTR95_010766 [Oleoguttula sp. CCFEE 5521]